MNLLSECRPIDITAHLAFSTAQILLLVWTRTSNLGLHNLPNHKPPAWEFSQRKATRHKVYQHVAVIFGKVSYSQGESQKKIVKPGSHSFHFLVATVRGQS